MPPARRKHSGPSARGAQSTLSFGNRAKVTKPSIAPVSKPSKPDPALPEIDAKVTESPVIEAPTTAEIAIEEQAHAEIAKLKTKAEEKAEEITDAQIKRYWKSREDERKAARVHQEGLSMNEKILRHFDLSSQYGPCIGIARMKRWNRAENLNLHPPIEVLAVLLKEDAKSNTRSERAYVDELMSSRFIIN